MLESGLFPGRIISFMRSIFEERGMIDPKLLQGLLGTVQEQMQELDREAERKVVEAKSGGGLVDVKFNGKGELVDINIDDELLEDKQALQLLLISALNDGYKQIEETKRDAIMGRVKNFDIGNLFKM